LAIGALSARALAASRLIRRIAAAALDTRARAGPPRPQRTLSVRLGTRRACPHPVWLASGRASSSVQL